MVIRVADILFCARALMDEPHPGLSSHLVQLSAQRMGPTAAYRVNLGFLDIGDFR